MIYGRITSVKQSMVHSLSSKLLPRWKRFIFSFIGIVLSLIFSLTAAELVLRYQRQYIEHSDQLESGMMLYDRQLGWRLTPGWQDTHHHYDFDTSYHVIKGVRVNDLTIKSFTLTPLIL